MTLEVFQLCDAIDRIINNGIYDYCRSYMSQRVNDARSTFARRDVSDSHAVRSLNLQDFPLDLANAICHPKVLSFDELSEIVILYGNFFSWRTEHLSKLLAGLPGGVNFKVLSESWPENMRKRKLIPNASVIRIAKARLHHPSKSMNEFTKNMGAFGYDWETEPRNAMFFFEDRDTAVLAMLKCA